MSNEACFPRNNFNAIKTRYPTGAFVLSERSDPMPYPTPYPIASFDPFVASVKRKLQEMRDEHKYPPPSLFSTVCLDTSSHPGRRKKPKTSRELVIDVLLYHWENTRKTAT